MLLRTVKTSSSEGYRFKPLCHLEQHLQEDGKSARTSPNMMAKIKGGGGHSESSSSHPGHQIGGNAGSSGSFGGSAGATSPVRHNPLTYQHGHSFIKKTFHKPTTNCHFCAELLWGLMGQGYICEGKTIFFFKKATQQISSKNA